MKANYKVDRSYLNFIHARNFFPENDAENCRLTVKDLLHYNPNPYGTQIPEFNLIFPEEIFAILSNMPALTEALGDAFNIF